MAKACEVADGIIELETEWGKHGRTTTAYLVVDEETALIETGPSAAVPGLMEAMRLVKQDPATISYVVPTHIHLDHGGGAGFMSEKVPSAKVVVHQSGARHLLDTARLIASTRLSFGDNFHEEYGPILSLPAERLMVVQGGETIKLGQRVLSIIHTPGHAPHHIGIFDSKTRGLFCGEALGSRQPGKDIVAPSAAPPGFDLEHALESMERLKDLSPALLLYSHGGVTDHVDNLTRMIIEQTRAYGEIILTGLRAGQSKEEIAQRITQYHLGAEPSVLGQREAYRPVERGYRLTMDGYIHYFERNSMV